MSFKEPIEDKQETPLPRSLVSLKSIVTEAQGMIRAKRVGELPGLLEELKSQRRRCNAEQLQMGQVGAPAELFVQYADALNQSMETLAEGQALCNPGSVARFTS